MVQPNTDSFDGKSSEEMKQMLKQTSVVDSDEETEEREEAVTETEETREETKPDETEESETEKEVKSREETEEPRYKLKVEGKEEELPLPKVLEYAQKGRYLEREMKKLKDERERLKGERREATPSLPQNAEQMNDWFVKEVQANPVPTLLNVIKFGLDQEKEKDKQERSKDTEFELEKSDEHGELWKDIGPRYRKFRDLGFSRDESEAKATADFWKDTAIFALQKGRKEGTKKQKMKQAAEIPSGEKRTGTSTGIPSPDQLKGKSS